MLKSNKSTKQLNKSNQTKNPKILLTKLTNFAKNTTFLLLSLLISLTSILPILLPAIATAAPGDWQWEKSNGIVGDTIGWQSITSSADGTKLAAVANDWGDGYYIYTSTDSGVSWTEQTSSGQRYWSSIASSADGTKLAAVDINGYIYTSTDSGVSWTEQTSSGQRSWQSITSSADGTKLAAVEFAGCVYTSTDSGATWTEQSSAWSYWQSITSSADGTKLAAVDINGYIYTSTDSGASWTTQTSSGQRSWYSITSSADGNKLAAVDYNGYIYTSTDSGASWQQQTAAGSRYWYSITSSSDGTKLAAVAYNGYIYTSTDSGATWSEQTSSGQRYWSSIASSADGTKLASVTYNDSIYLGTIEPSTIPSTATSLTTTRGNSQVSLTWATPDSDGGSPITDYIVQYKPTADSTWQTFADGTSANTNTTVTSLTNGTQYDFRVRAVNSVGEGNNSSVESATPATIPSAPSITAIPETDEVNLTWSSPDNGGSPITDYIVQYKLTADSTWQTFADGTNDNTSVSVTGLDFNTSYDFQVAAKNIVGDGSFSSTVTVTTLAMPTPPTSNTANLTTPTSPISAFSLRPVSISTPTGTNISSSSTVPESSLVTQDSSNQYPLGLVNFSFTTNQSSNQVVLTFITDLTPNQVTPKKYNPSTNTYTNLPSSANAVVSETTIDNQHALVLTYTLIDNGELDLDPTAGTISDPVGLAVSNSTYDQLASTGDNNTIIYLSLASSLIVIASWLAIATRKRKLHFRA